MRHECLPLLTSIQTDHFPSLAHMSNSVPTKIDDYNNVLKKAKHSPPTSTQIIATIHWINSSLVCIKNLQNPERKKELPSNPPPSPSEQINLEWMGDLLEQTWTNLEEIKIHFQQGDPPSTPNDQKQHSAQALLYCLWSRCSQVLWCVCPAIDFVLFCAEFGFDLCAVFNALKPVISKFAFWLPKNGLQFTHHQPAILVDVDSVEKILPFTEECHFSEAFNVPVTKIPSTVKRLEFGADFNSRVCFSSSSSVTHLYLGDAFNTNIQALPPSLLHLEFGCNFNLPFTHHHESITHITFGHFFNQQFSSQSASLTHLVFGEHFNQPVPSLPPNLVSLTFGDSFNHPAFLKVGWR